MLGKLVVGLEEIGRSVIGPRPRREYANEAAMATFGDHFTGFRRNLCGQERHNHDKEASCASGHLTCW